MVTAPTFYNLKDQGIYSAGDFFIPQEKYRAAPYTAGQPNNPDDVPSGIPAVYQAQGRDGGFNPYNTDMSGIRQDYNPFPSRQAGEIYSKTFNPQPFKFESTPGGLEYAQGAYNMATKGIDQGFGNMRSDDGRTVFEMQKEADDLIQDARMQYATEGQFVDPYDPRYSSITEAQKFMDNYPDYYYGPPKTRLEQLGSKAINFIPGIGTVTRIAGFLSDKLPINERAIMENEARGAGIFTDDIGRIVTDDYNTAGGIMAGYKLNKIDAGTFDKLRSTIEKTNADKKAKGLDTTTLEERLGLLDDAEEKIEGARKKKKQVYKMRKDKKDADKKRREEEKAAAAAAAAKKAEIQKIQSQLNNTGVTGSNYNQAANIAGGGGGDTATYGGQTAREATYDGNPNTGTSQGYSQHYMDGGRVYYMNGGLADMLEIYD